MMTAVEKLEAWFQAEKKAGNIVDLKFFPVEHGDPERLAEAVLKSLSGETKSEVLDVRSLDTGDLW